MAADGPKRSGGGESVILDVAAELIELDAPMAGIDQQRVQALAEWVVSAEEQCGNWSVNVVLVDDARLRELHRSFMGIDEVTDVMTFPFDPAEARSGGEIVVSIERAMEQGPAHGHSPLAEVEFLIVHGLLHLCGWDDATLEARDRMLARQTELLQGLIQRAERTDGS